MYYYRQKKRPPLQPPGHLCVAVAYLSSASVNHLPDSELGRQPQGTDVQVVAGRGRFFSVYDSTGWFLGNESQ